MLSKLGSLLQLHFSVVDAKGNSLVLEFETGSGRLLMHDNPLGAYTISTSICVSESLTRPIRFLISLPSLYVLLLGFRHIDE